jgi:glutamate-1-semialdehyde 2,1-aminomutase
VNDGIPLEENETVRGYSYNTLMDITHPTSKCFGYNEKPEATKLEWMCSAFKPAAIILDPATVDITCEKLQYIRDLCDKYGCLMILDETISGFRYHIRGVQGLYGVKPDLACYGKGMGNGYAVSCLAGRKEIMDLGLRGKGNVFLLSGTYFSNTPDLAAAIATIQELRDKNIPECIWNTGLTFSDMLLVAIQDAKMSNYIQVNNWMPCNPSIQYATYDDSFTPMQLKTLFDQEMVRQGVLMPYISISYSHTDKEVLQTIEAAEIALAVCRKAIDNDCVKESLVNGHCEAPVFRRC